MKKHAYIFLLSSLLLSACATSPKDQHQAYCNTLKSQLIFNARSFDTRRANEERAERTLLQHNFDTAHCE